MFSFIVIIEISVINLRLFQSYRKSPLYDTNNGLTKNCLQAISRNTTLLIDDDGNNIRIALENKVRAVHFDTKNIKK
jgi:hypothetical protein